MPARPCCCSTDAEHAGRYVEHYNRLVPRLVERAFEVRAFDLAGHGLSPGVRGVTDIGRMADVHLAARRMLAGRPLFLFGHSLGGLVTALAAAGEIERGLAGWRAPTFVVHGAADTYTDPKGSERLHGGIASADKQLWLVPGGRHELLNDPPRDEVLARVLGGLEARN